MIILIVGIVLIVFGVFTYVRTHADSVQKLPIAAIQVGATPFVVEVASTFMERAQGLSGHVPLGANDGMLFVFPSPSAGAFWMQGMLFPIDFVWIADGRVVGVTEDALPMSETGYQLYYPPAPVDQVLEINAGAVREFGIAAGDAVYY